MMKINLTHRGIVYLDLMVTAAVISILAAIAVPQFTTYIHKAYKLSAGLRVIEIQDQIGRYYSWHGKLPLNNKVLGIPSPQGLASDYIDNIRIENGVIHFEFGNKVPEEIVKHKKIYTPVLAGTQTSRISSWKIKNEPSDSK